MRIEDIVKYAREMIEHKELPYLNKKSQEYLRRQCIENYGHPIFDDYSIFGKKYESSKRSEERPYP